MRDLMQNAPCGFVAVADDGTIAEVNETLAEMLGYARLDLLGWHIDKMLPPGGRIFCQTYLFPMLKVQGKVEEIYLAMRTRDGHDVPVLLNGIRRERDGHFVSDCVCVRMIQRNEYEQQLLEARRLAELSSASKAKFLSMMSHDLRTPLTTILGNSQLLRTGEFGPLTADQLESLNDIESACRMQLTLMNDILEFARLDSGQVQVQLGPVSLGEVVVRAAALVHVQAEDAGLTLVAEGCPEPGSVIADANRLQQILLNLLTNAFKFTPRGGVVRITCEHGPERSRIHVSDTGIGISAEDLGRIFTPFVQVESESRESSRGVGLGLAISRDLARAMNGDVTAVSRPGEGSVFTIELPAAEATSRAS